MRNRLILIIGLMFLLVLLSSNPVSATWWNVSYTYKMPINCTNLDNNVPIVINGSDGFILNGNKQIVWTYCSGTGTALYLHNSTDNTAYVVANDTTQLPHEVESGDAPSYNNQSVWDANFKMVQHMKDYTTSIVLDSTSNINNGTKLSAGNPAEAEAKIGKGQDFSSDSIATTYASMRVTGDLTLEAWVKTDAASATVGVIGTCYYKEYYFQANADNTFKFYHGSDGSNFDIITTTAETLSTSTWYYVVAVRNTSSGIVRIYVNGTDKTSGTGAYVKTPTAGTDAVLTGSCGCIAQLWNGLIDSVRVSNKARDSNYITQTYNNVLGTSGYGNLGAEESQAPSRNTAPIVTANATRPTTVYTNTDWKLNITATDIENATFTSYTQFYINGSSSGSVLSHSISNNTNTNVANLSSASFGKGANLTAEMWVSDVEYNSSKFNSTQVTVQEIPTPPAVNITLTLEGLSQNISAELGSLINVTSFVNASNGIVYIDIDHPDYGVNYLSGVDSVTFDLNITYFEKDNIMYLTNGSISNQDEFSFDDTSITYQENANVTTVFLTNESGGITLEYNKTDDTYGMIWEVKHGWNGTDALHYNITIPDDCYTYYDDYVKVKIEGYHSLYSGIIVQYPMSQPYCYSGTWETIGTNSLASNIAGGHGSKSPTVMYDNNWNTGAFAYIVINSSYGWRYAAGGDFYYAMIYEEAMHLLKEPTSNSFKLGLHKGDDVINLTLNLTGTQYDGSFAEMVGISINGELDKTIFSTSNETNKYQNEFNDRSTTKSKSFYGFTTFGYIKLPKTADVINAYFNITGVKEEVSKEPDLVINTGTDINGISPFGNYIYVCEAILSPSSDLFRYKKTDGSFVGIALVDACNGYGTFMDTNGTHLFISSTNNNVNIYNSALTLVNTISFGVGENADSGLGMNATHIFRGSVDPPIIYLYHYNGTYDRIWLNVTPYLKWPIFYGDISVSEEYVWIIDEPAGRNLIVFYINGTYIETIDFDDYYSYGVSGLGNIANDGTHLYGTEGYGYDFARYIIGDYPYNFFIKIGGQAYNYTYNISGEFTTTNITTNMSEHFNDYLSDTAQTDVVNVPVYMSSERYGKIEVNSINITYLYEFNPISLDVDLIQGIIDSSNLTGEVNVTITLESETEGNVTVDIDKYDYKGGNKTYTVLAHDDTYSTNVSYDITYYYSKFNVSIIPPNIDYWDIGANVFSWIQNFIPPFGNEDGDGNPFFNIKSLAYGTKGIDVYVRYNESISSCATTWFEGKNQTTNLPFNITLNTSAQVLMANFTSYEQSSNVSTWTNISCASENSTLIIPYFCFFSMCDSCILTSDWDSNCDLIE